MWFVLFFVSCTCLLEKGYGNDEILGTGQWLVLNILECEEAEQYDVPMRISQKKMNRTHDAFSLYAEFDRDLDYTFGVEIIAKKEVDGGYKFYQQLIEDSLCNALEKYSGTNWQDALTKANIDPPECPVPAGEFKIDDFVIDYRQLKETGMYGKYDASLYITHMGLRLACARILVEFEKQPEDDDDDDDY